MPCVHHPSRAHVPPAVYGRDYCARCRSGIAASQKAVPGHVEPKDCFVWYEGGDDWDAISGTGCAHWVAHQLNVPTPAEPARCLANKPVRVARLIEGRRAIARRDVAVNDIYVTESGGHCGLVMAVSGAGMKIMIRHDSSAQGKVIDSDFDEYFGGRGRFVR